VILTAVLLALPLGVGAAGLGKITVLSALGQPLRAEVDVTASREELSSLAARVASAEAFKQAGVEYTSALTMIRLTVDRRADGSPFLSMVSDRPLNEPFLDLLVELNWNSGRLVREYTFLLDPPGALQQPSSPATASGSPPTAAPAAAPETRRETAPTGHAPAAGQIETRDAPPSQDMPAQPQLRPEMKAARGADGSPRSAKAETVRREAEGSQRLVKRGDTLSQIAIETKPEGVNLDQMLVALFRGNPDAFEGNVNRLRAGKILAIPGDETAANVDAMEAKKTVLAHSADFNAYVKKLAGSVANAAGQKDEPPKRSVSGKIAPKVEDKMPPALPGTDKLEVSKSEQASGAAGKAGAVRLAAIEETLIAREKALKDANSRIAELERNLNDLRKLIELKNQGMAELQKQAQVVKPVVPSKLPPTDEAKKPKTPSERPAEKLAEKSAVAEKAPVALAQPKSAPAEKKPAPPPPPPESSYTDESPEIVFGGGGILALLLFYFGYKRYQQRKGSTLSRSQGSEPFSSSAAGGLGAPTLDSGNLLTGNDLSDLSSVAAGDGDAGVDPIAEADVYLAYGRDVQAEEILLDALKTDPKRHALHLKLLEIYANRKSNKQFESIAGDLHNQTGGSGPDWERAAKMGQQIDPSNPLYGAGVPSEKGFDPDATLVIRPHEEEFDLGSLTTAASAGEESLQSTQASQPANETPAPPQEELPASLDFEFDLAEPEPTSSPASRETAAVSSAPEDSTAIDIDLGLDTATQKPVDKPLEPTADEKSSQEAMPLVADFDLDLDLGPKAEVTPESAPGSSASPRANASADAASGLDFNFDLDAGEPALSSPVPEAIPDRNSIDFDIEVTTPAAAQPAASSVDFSSINLDLGEPVAPATALEASKAGEPVDAATQDVETKLELAQAYDEMGDKEGARELLQEVLNEGNAVQKETARSRLERLA